MTWWDGLWLNESYLCILGFADCVALYALTKMRLSFKISDFGVMQNMRKEWGYNTDMKITTHPISHSGKELMLVRDTEQAETIFDGITYAKGASVLR